MIIEKQTEIEILSDGESQQSIDMSLDLDSANMLMQMLSKNLYSDGIGSAIRETASNALDSHRNAKVDKPIIVSLIKNDEGNFEFSVEDFGTGLDNNDVDNIISKYGKSTKRMDANALGMFGLGFKSPLAYSSSFYFVCRKDGIERKYMMYEGEDINKIESLYEEPTTEGNGVKIIIPVKWNDRWEFVKKIKEQLAYFEGVYFNMENVGDSIDNDFKIHRSEFFQTSELSTDSNLHICLDNVYYPLDFIKLGIPRIHYNIALRFSLSDGIFPTPNRESIRYTSEAKKVILERLKQFSDFMMDKYNESVIETDDIKYLFDYYTTGGRHVILEKKSYEISPLIPFSTRKIKEPKLKGITLLDLKHLYRHRVNMFEEYEMRYILRNDRFSSQKGRYRNTISIWDLESCDTIYLFNERIGNNKKIFIKTRHNSYEKIGFIKKTLSFPLFPSTGSKTSFNNYYNLLKLDTIPKKDWRTVIKEFQFVLSLFLKDVKDFDKIIIPQSWHDARKKRRSKVLSTGVKRVKLQGEVVFKQAEDLLRYVEGKTCKFVSEKLKLEDIHKQSNLYVYGTTEQQSDLDPLYNIFSNQKVKFISFSQRELKVISELEIHNLISIEKFMEGKNKPFKRLITGWKIRKLIDEYSAVFGKYDRLENVSKDLSEKLHNLNNYSDKNTVRGHYSIYESLEEVADTYNLYDECIYPEYLECKSILEKLTFLNPIMERMRGYSNEEDLQTVLVDLFKYYKTKVNFERYHMRINEDLPLEAVLTEETIDELTTAVD